MRYLGTFLVCRHPGTLLALVHWGQVCLHQVGADSPGPIAPISYALDEELAFLPHDANLAQHLGNSG